MEDFHGKTPYGAFKMIKIRKILDFLCGVFRKRVVRKGGMGGNIAGKYRKMEEKHGRTLFRPINPNDLRGQKGLSNEEFLQFEIRILKLRFPDKQDTLVRRNSLLRAREYSTVRS